MEGKLHITGTAVAQSNMADMGKTSGSVANNAVPTPLPMKAEANGVWAIRNPADLPAPIGSREPQTIKVSLTAKEVTTQLADGVSYTFFTFDGQIPGPMIRGRVGDTFEITLRNDKSSTMPHSIDLHAVNGPGGGAIYTQTNPDGTTTFSFKALNPGIYVYHCATPSVAHHIQSGMYGMILIEPEGGLPKVDKEFYVMQGEVYTDFPFGTKGHMNFSNEKMLNETPEYFIFNGAAGALTRDEFALRAKVGDTVRIFFGVGGPNATSSFHVIGEIFDRVYDQGSLTSQPQTNVQTTGVPPGAATMVEFTLNVPGRYILVDHALSRLERGLAGYLYAEGDTDNTLFAGTLTSGSGH
jgi:nitrite reductase (NO-forming)